jgi:hypothetical protein
MVLLIVFVATPTSSTYGAETSKPVPCLGAVQLTCEDARNLDAYVVKLETELAAAQVPPPPKDDGSSNYPLVVAASAALGAVLGVLAVILVK